MREALKEANKGLLRLDEVPVGAIYNLCIINTIIAKVHTICVQSDYMIQQLMRKCKHYHLCLPIIYKAKYLDECTV